LISVITKKESFISIAGFRK